MPIDTITFITRVGVFYNTACATKLTKPTSQSLKSIKLPSYIVLHYTTISFLLSLLTPNYSSSVTNTTLLQLSQKTCTLVVIVFVNLLLLAGDVHTNPGPNTNVNTVKLHDTLPCYFLNARSIKKIDGRQHKLREFKELLFTLNPSILAVSETWLTKNILSTEIATPEEFTIYRKDRIDRKGGGVLLLVEPNIKSDRKFTLESNSTEHNEILVVELDLSMGNKYALIVAYRSQKDPYPLFLRNFTTTLDNCIRANYTNLLVLGDFNYSDITWDQALDTNLPLHCRNFLNAIQPHGLEQLNFNPSRANNTNILDLILTNTPDKMSKIYANLFTYKSDHYLLHFDFTTKVERLTKPNRTVYNFKHADFDKINNDIAASNINNTVSPNLSMDTNLNNWTDTLMSIINTNIPKITIKHGFTPPWFDHNIFKHLRKKNSALKQAKKHDTDTLWAKFKRLRNNLKNLISLRHAEYLYDMCNNLTANPKRFWSFLKSKTKSRGIPKFLRTDNNTKETDNKSMATIFNLFFHSTFTPPTNNPLPPITVRHDPNLSNITLTQPEVLKQLHKLNPSKASGPDSIPTKVLKECAHAISDSLTSLFNISLATATLPTSWKHANIIPIHKKGDKHAATNYRPISLLPVISKVLERCLYNKIIDFLIPKITNLQHGFLRNRSTATQLMTIFTNINTILDSGTQSDTVYFDLSKAFDSVPHRLLIHKLKSFGLHGTLLAWIENYLTHRWQRVSINGTNSDWLKVTSGVPQGSILGPLLFILYINDLPTVLSPNTLCAIFADDTKISRHIVSHQDHLILQRDINNVHNWSTVWGLTFNDKKCMVLSLIRNGRPTLYNYSMNSTTLARTNSMNDLGITITTTLHWNEHIGNITSKANQKFWLTVRTLGYDAPTRSKLTTYVALVRPNLEYNTVIWSPSTKDNITSLESIQRKATNFITNNPKRPSPLHVDYKTRLIECKLLPLSYRREVYDLVFFLKSLKGMISFNILNHLHFQNNPVARTRNQQHGLNLIIPKTKLTSSAHFYPSRIARIWNTLPISLRFDLVSPIPISSVKTLLNKHYHLLLMNTFDPDNLCTWVSACHCGLCRPF